jgi:quercetin dioxygenase-like cupin family protein
MILKSIPETAISVDAPIDGKIMFGNPRIESILITLQPGETISEHTNPFDVLFIGLIGQAIIGSENKSFEIAPCQTIYIPKGLPRFLKNDTAGEIKVMVIKLL